MLIAVRQEGDGMRELKRTFQVNSKRYLIHQVSPATDRPRRCVDCEVVDEVGNRWKLTLVRTSGGWPACLSPAARAPQATSFADDVNAGSVTLSRIRTALVEANGELYAFHELAGADLASIGLSSVPDDAGAYPHPSLADLAHVPAWPLP